jgi:hypothetical protein
MPETPNLLNSESPICLAINICNEVIVDARSNNKSLISCFNGIVTQQLPAMHPRMFIVASITNVFQDSDVIISARDPQYNEILQFQAHIAAGDPLAVHDLIVEVHNLQLPFPGTYFVDVIYKEELLSERRFIVQFVPQPGSQPGFPGQLPQ